MEDVLKIGDVFYIPRDFKVYADVPEKFVYNNFSEKLTSTTIMIGETLVTAYNVGLHAVATKIKESVFVTAKTEIPIDIIKRFLKDNLPMSLEEESINTADYIGEYIVIDARLGGGSHGHDSYPDGWRVKCKKLTSDGFYDESGFEVSFYQSGDFTVVHIPSTIDLLRKMEKKTTFS